MEWRTMTADEAVSHPDNRLGGVLLAMLALAALVCVIEVAGSIFAFAQLRAIGLRYIVAVGFAFFWSLGFVVMTLARARATPVAASAGLFAWVVWRFVAAIPFGGWPLIVDLLVELAMAGGFCAYMTGGVRPNAYYRRRVLVT